MWWIVYFFGKNGSIKTSWLKGSTIPIVGSSELSQEKTFRRASTVHCIEGLKQANQVKQSTFTKQLSGSEGALNDIALGKKILIAVVFWTNLGFEPNLPV